jgi:hypothetical protein
LRGARHFYFAATSLRSAQRDIKPGNDLDPINPASQGVITVAILGSSEFDLDELDLATLAFGPDRATPPTEGAATGSTSMETATATSSRTSQQPKRALRPATLLPA